MLCNVFLPHCEVKCSTWYLLYPLRSLFKKKKKKIPVLGFPEVDTELKDVKRPPCWVLDRGGSGSTE